MKRRPSIRYLLTSACVLFFASSAFAQGCALCYTQAASAPTRFIHALRGGILVLIFPPLFISVSLAVAAYRKRNRFYQGRGGQNLSLSATIPEKTAL